MTSRASVGLARVARDDAVELRADRRRAPRRAAASSGQRGAPPAARAKISRAMRERVGVVGGEVVGDARDARVHVAAAELLGGDLLAGRGLHERRAAEEDRALVLAR